MPTADTRKAAEDTTHTVIIGVGLLDQEIAWRYDRAPLAPAAIDAERTLLGIYADAELDGDPLRSPADLIMAGLCLLCRLSSCCSLSTLSNPPALADQDRTRPAPH